MRHAASVVISLAAAALLGSCAAHPVSAMGANSREEEAPSLAAVRALTAAFNAHDPAAMRALVTDDVEVIYVSGGTSAPDVTGAAALEEAMGGYFASTPGVRSSLEDATVSGPFVAIRERVTWTGKDGRPRTQASVGVFEVKDGKVRRAWYYPAQR